jgi:hypothetical protein
MIPLMVVDESERIPKWRFYSSDEVLMSRETTEVSDEGLTKGAPKLVQIPKRSSLQRTCSVPTSFKERKRHFQTHKRSKTSPLPIIRRWASSSFVSAVADKKRKCRAFDTPCPERHDSRRWVYATRDEYSRFLIPRTVSTESTRAVDKVEQDEDMVLLGLAFVDEADC